MRIASALVLVLAAPAALAQQDDAIREVEYDPRTVLHVPVARGVPTHVELEGGETLVNVAPGVGSDCAQPEHTWCIEWQEGGNRVFVKPREGGARNPVELVTSRRSISLQFDVSPRPARRVMVVAKKPPAPDPVQARVAAMRAAALALAPQPEELVERRMALRPQVLNAAYSVAVGEGSEDLKPRAVFDDGRFTYLQYPGNREMPAAFLVNPDGSEQVVNLSVDASTREFLVIDRVAREIVLRSGAQVVSVRNTAFDADGRAPQDGSAAEGVQRLVRNPKTGQFEEAAQ